MKALLSHGSVSFDELFRIVLSLSARSSLEEKNPEASSRLVSRVTNQGSRFVLKGWHGCYHGRRDEKSRDDGAGALFCFRGEDLSLEGAVNQCVVQRSFGQG